jgi:hypothetical protein
VTQNLQLDLEAHSALQPVPLAAVQWLHSPTWQAPALELRSSSSYISLAPPADCSDFEEGPAQPRAADIAHIDLHTVDTAAKEIGLA